MRLTSVDFFFVGLRPFLGYSLGSFLGIYKYELYSLNNPVPLYTIKGVFKLLQKLIEILEIKNLGKKSGKNIPSGTRHPSGT